MCGKDTVSLGNGAASACLVGAGETNFSGWSSGGGRVDGDLRDRVVLTGTADRSDAPRFRATPLPTKQHVETGCGCGSWEMSQECMTSALAWCLEIPGSTQPHLPSSLIVHPALTFPAVPWWTQPWELSLGTQLCLPWPQGQAPFSLAGGDLEVRCFQGNEVIRNSLGCCRQLRVSSVPAAAVRDRTLPPPPGPPKLPRPPQLQEPTDVQGGAGLGSLG